MHFSFPWLLLFASSPLLSASENPGIKMTIEYGQAGNSNQQTIYLQGDRKRVEFRNSYGRDGSLQQIYGPRLVAITRCDLGQSFELNLDTSEYTAAPYPPAPLSKEEVARRGLPVSATYASDKPTLRIEVTTNDSGERKEIFGQIARHVITTRKQIPFEGSSSKPEESVTDAWYIDSKSVDLNIDFRQRLPCDRKLAEGKSGYTYSYLQTARPNRPEKPEFVTVGEPETGFAVHSVTITKGTYPLPDGTNKQSESKFELRVTQLEVGALDPALFEIPPGFKHVDHMERNPPASALAGQAQDFWQRVKAGVAGLLNR